MRVIQTVSEFREYRRSLGDSTLAFIPTMGALHDGHLSLISTAKTVSNIVIVSIYVNPTQFGKNEDLNRYPKPLEADLDKLSKLNVDVVFTPNNEEIYPKGLEESTQVIVPILSEKWCGFSRPQFFKGITKVVLRLFNIVQPTHAIFGEKDFQQLQIIKRMVSDLFLEITIIGSPTTREKNGLAMSSRNQYLSENEKEMASVIYRAFNDVKTNFKNGLKEIQSLTEIIRKQILKTDIEIDYLAIVDSETLEVVPQPYNGCRIVFAGTLNDTRLIDNMKL